VTPEITILLGATIFWAIGLGIVLGRISRNTEVARHKRNQELARECMREAFRGRDDALTELYTERTRRQFLENMVEAEKGRRLWN
jgi:hypothetical protein